MLVLLIFMHLWQMKCLLSLTTEVAAGGEQASSFALAEGTARGCSPWAPVKSIQGQHCTDEHRALLARPCFHLAMVGVRFARADCTFNRIV